MVDGQLKLDIEMNSADDQRESFLYRREWSHINRHQSVAWSQIRSCLAGIVGSWMLLTCGCLTTEPYEYGRFHPDRPTGSNVTQVSIDYGKPNKTLDRIGNIMSTPAKLLALNSKIDNHHVSEETLEKLTDYLKKNDITDVRIAVNDYSPKEQWRRIRENTSVSAGWKYTVGTLSWMGYTTRPGRLFGGTEYNPFTNTIYVNSDVPAVLLAEAAYAKDIHAQTFPGTYAVFANGLPVIKIWRQSRAISDVLGYARAEQDWDVEQETYRVMYPQIGAATAGGAGMFVTGSAGTISSMLVGPLLGATGAAAGHAAGRTISKRRESELKHIADCNEVLENAERSKGPKEQPSEIDDQFTSAEVDGKFTIVQASHDDAPSDVATGGKESETSDDCQNDSVLE